MRPANQRETGRTLRGKFYRGMAMREGVRRLWKLVNQVDYYQHIRDNMKMWNRAQYKIQQTEGYY